MKAKEVMRIGRNLVRAASTAASNIGLRSMILSFARHLDDQNAILGRQGDQKHQPDLNIKIIVDPETGQRCHRAEQRKWNRRDHGERQDPALILPGKDEIDKQHRQGKAPIEQIAGDLFLIGHGGPFVADVAWQRLGGNMPPWTPSLGRN